MRRGERGAAYRDSATGRWEPVNVLKGLLDPKAFPAAPLVSVRRLSDGRRLIADADLRFREVPR